MCCGRAGLAHAALETNTRLASSSVSNQRAANTRSTSSEASLALCDASFHEADAPQEGGARAAE